VPVGWGVPVGGGVAVGVELGGGVAGWTVGEGVAALVGDGLTGMLVAAAVSGAEPVAAGELEGVTGALAQPATRTTAISGRRSRLTTPA
jgi:hypothetical protein